ELANAEDGGATHPGSLKALLLLGHELGFEVNQDPSLRPPEDRRKAYDSAGRQARTVAELVNHTQALLRATERHRDKAFWAPPRNVSVDEWEEKRLRFKDILWE